MSLHEYRLSLTIASQAYPFYALIMAAMRQADTSNLQALKDAFPPTFQELFYRYHAPGGSLPTEKP